MILRPWERGRPARPVSRQPARLPHGAALPGPDPPAPAGRHAGGTILLANSVDPETGPRQIAGVRAAPVHPLRGYPRRACGRCPHSGNLASTECSPISPAVSGRPRSQGRKTMTHTPCNSFSDRAGGIGSLGTRDGKTSHSKQQGRTTARSGSLSLRPAWSGGCRPGSPSGTRRPASCRQAGASPRSGPHPKTHDAPPSVGESPGHPPAQAQRVNPRERTIAHVPIQVHPARVPARIARQKAPPRRVVVAVGEQHQVGLAIGIIPPLTAKAKRGGARAAR
jgi:hypothetical protein